MGTRLRTPVSVSLALFAAPALLALACGSVSSVNGDGGGGSGGTGMAGRGGTSGSAGTTGTAGTAGTTGTAGTSGNAGTTGTGGTTGVAGTGGRGGTTGTAGTTGGGGTTGKAGSGGAGGAGCFYNGTTYPLGTTFPDADGCNTCVCATGGQIGCTDRACPPPDGGSPTCAFDAIYKYGMIGGHVAYRDEATLSPPNTYRYTRMPAGTGTTTMTCSPALPACGSANAIDVADIMRDLADPDVQHAFEAKSPPLYGRDSRPNDGSLFNVARADGRGFMIGPACTSSGSDAGACVDPPAGVTKLMTDLRALDEQQLKGATCLSTQ